MIRDLFSKTAEARARGYKPGRFSFNVKGGRCEVCRGDGQIRIEMHFLPDVYVPCEQCHGRRYNRETLEVRFKGKTIADVLDMPVEEALAFFEHIPSIRRRLATLADVGLGYIRLGQPATTLSGGEAQRIKLATELSKIATGRTLYILDEPTTGLHFADVKRLLEVLSRLVDAGNTVVVIEHNLDVIKSADRLIDLGPEGGDEGGRVVAAGTPEQVAAVPESHTGRFLEPLLAPAPTRAPAQPPRSRQPRQPEPGAVTRRRRAEPARNPLELRRVDRERVLRGGEAASANLVGVVADRRHDLRAQLRVLLGEARRVARVDAEQVVQHEHLAVGVRAGADPDHRDLEQRRDRRGDRGRDRLEHDRERTRRLERRVPARRARVRGRRCGPARGARRARSRSAASARRAPSPARRRRRSPARARAAPGRRPRA